MDDAARDIVIVGAGQAGASLAQTLRAEGYDGRLTLIGEEPEPPYQRPPLSKKYLLGEMAWERLHLKPPSFYAEQDIKLITGRRITGVDRAALHLRLGDARLTYDRLALTTGATPRRLPEAVGGTLAGVHVIRNRADVDALAPALVEGARALVVGGGYIGLEAAAVLRQLELSVTLVELSERILNRVASPETAAFLRDLHRTKGVDIREGTALSRLAGEDRVSEAVFADGTVLPVDVVIVGIGVVPETGLAEVAGLTLDNGIAVDGACRTSDPAIFAAGDCASFPYRDGRIRLESVQNAIDQGAHAARAMLGDVTAYAPVPWFWSDQYEARLQIAGLNSGYTDVIERPGARAGGRSFWYFERGRFLAVDAVSDPKAYMQGKRWLEGGAAVDPAVLADADRALGDAVRVS